MELCVLNLVQFSATAKQTFDYVHCSSYVIRTSNCNSDSVELLFFAIYAAETSVIT
jgi:hypothetical protein